MSKDFTGFSSENLTRMLDEWSADQREREGWKNGDQSTYRFRANLLEASSQRIAALTAELEAVRRDAARLDYIERTFSGMTNRERYLPVQMIWGKGCNGRTLREACDKYMKRDKETASG